MAMTSASLPSLMPDAEHHRLMRRLEHNARAREKADRLEGSNSVMMGLSKQQSKREHSQFIMDMQKTHQERVDRWTRKTQANPLNADLWAEDQKIFELNRARDKQERQQRKREEKLRREAHESIYARAMADVDELAILRNEKRMLVQNEKELKAMRDVERTNGRASKVLQQRKARELERQQAQLERALSEPRFC
uniref:Uncharacterized protein n=1 Tax=Pyrodinium bahamense TaxID=73915 RepID=A0A7R9ZUT9_9DINO|mmetsp:Transcript_10484/g.29140  ORF Transcript_10484/g.29140 Transcript_10484/m.29140 type:complete len:194 (+) Transcript_10484:96-677(+)